MALGKDATTSPGLFRRLRQSIGGGPPPKLDPILQQKLDEYHGEPEVGNLLHFAAHKNYTDLVDYVYTAGPRRHRNWYKRDRRGQTPLDIALARAHIPFIRRLEEYGYKCDVAQLIDRYVAEDKVSTVEAVLDTWTLDDNDILRHFRAALTARSFSAANALICANAFQVSAKARHGRYLFNYGSSLLSQECWNTHRMPLETILQSLQRCGLDVNDATPPPPDVSLSDFGKSWIHFVNDAHRLDCLSSLIAQGAHINMRDGQGRTPIMVAIASARFGLNAANKQRIEALLACGADLSFGDQKGLCGWSLIMSDDFVGSQVFHFVLSLFEEIDWVDRDGRTLLHHAIDTNRGQLPLIIAKSAALINEPQTPHGTPLDYACSVKRWWYIPELLAGGAEVSFEHIELAVRSFEKTSTNPCKQLRQMLQRMKPLTRSDFDNDEQIQRLRSLLTFVIAASDIDRNPRYAGARRTEIVGILSSWLPAWLKDGHDLVACLKFGDQDLDTFRLLLRNGTNVNGPTGGLWEENRNNVLQQAIHVKCFEIAMTLLAEGADPNTFDPRSASIASPRGSSPLDIAIWRLKCYEHAPGPGSTACLRLVHKLRSMGTRECEANRAYLRPPTISNIAAIPGVVIVGPEHAIKGVELEPEPTQAEDVRAFDALGCNSLHWAVAKKDLAGVRRALAAGVDPKIPTFTGEYPVLVALEAGAADILYELFEKNSLTHPLSPNGTVDEAGEIDLVGAVDTKFCWTGPKVSYRDECLASGTLTYLMVAAVHGDVACVDALIRAGARINVRTGASLHVLHLLIGSRPAGYHEVALSLARANADVWAVEETNKLTPVHLAVMLGDARLLWALLMSREYRLGSLRNNRQRLYRDGGPPTPLEIAEKNGFQAGLRLFQDADEQGTYKQKTWESYREIFQKRRWDYVATDK